MFNIIGKTIGFINQSIAAFGITAGVAVAFTNVVARYAFDASLVWATELTIFLFLWSAFFGAAYCFKKDAHIAVTIVLDIMPSQIAKIMLLTPLFERCLALSSIISPVPINKAVCVDKSVNIFSLSFTAQ